MAPSKAAEILTEFALVSVFARIEGRAAQYFPAGYSGMVYVLRTEEANSHSVAHEGRMTLRPIRIYGI
jgi:hypothetical protein